MIGAFGDVDQKLFLYADQHQTTTEFSGKISTELKKLFPLKNSPTYEKKKKKLFSSNKK